MRAQESQDAGEGASSCADPDKNKPPVTDPDDDVAPSDPEDDQSPAETDPDSKNPDDGSPAPDPQIADGGDEGDGGAADGDAGGTDGGGNDGSGGSSEDEFSDGMSDNYSSAGDPIDLRLADKRHVQVDYLSRGTSALRLSRVYHSNLAAHPAWVTLPMGTGWHNFYDRSLQQISSSQMRLHRANGKVLDYVFSGVSWTTAMPGGVLTQIAGGWQYLNNRNVLETYGNDGRLQSMAQGGKVTQLQRDAGGRLLRVVNPFGRTLVFAYDGSGRLANLTLPDGNTLSYSYDSNNNLSSIRFPDNAVRQYLYENATYRNALTGVIDESGRRRLTWGYDSAGRPNYGHYGNGINAVSVVYNGDVVTTTDARGTQRIRTFGAAGPRRVLKSLQTTATADSPATTWSWNHDASGNVANLTSRTGEVRTASLDGRGRILSATRAAGTAVALNQQHTWHPTFRAAVQSRAAGVTVNRSVDAHGRIYAVTQTGTDGVTSTLVQRTYNAQQLLASQTDARGTTTSYAYDAAGNMVSKVNSLGQTTTYSNFDAHGRSWRVVRPNGTVVTRIFDARGRLVSRTVGSRTTTYSYDASNRLLQTSKPDGSWHRRNYDAAGFWSGSVNHRGETTALGRDADGRITSRTVYAANGSVAQSSFSQYDSRGRVAATIDTRGNRSVFRYANDGRLAASVNPLGHDVTLQLDALDRPVNISQPNTTAMRAAGGAPRVSTSMVYQPAAATLQQTVDTVGVATNYSSDALNRRVAETGNDAGSIGWVRNAAGDVTQYVGARGFTLAMSRDALGRVTTVTPNVGVATSFGYVPGRTDGLLASMSDTSGTTNWTYDAQGRLLSKLQTVASVSHALTISRDGLGRIASMTYPSGMRVDVTYSGDAVSALAVNGSTMLSGVSYLPFSQIATGWTWGNGSSHSRSFDADGRVTRVTLGSMTRNYGYDAAGRLTNYVDQTSAGVVNSNFGYDEAGQLINYTGPAGTFTFNYDTNGNRRSTVRNGVTQTLGYAAGSNRMTTSPRGTYAYWPDGIPSTDGYLSFAYDAYSRLTYMATTADRSQRTYNGQGMRVLAVNSYWLVTGGGGGTPNAAKSGAAMSVAPGKTSATEPPVFNRTTTTKSLSAASAGAAATSSAANPATGGQAISPLAVSAGSWKVLDTTRFLHADDGSLLGEYSTKSGQRETVWFNGQPVAAMINGVLHIVRSDHLNTPRSISRASDNAEVWRWDSDPFGSGAPVGSITYNLRFPGQQYDGYSGYYYNWMRDYDPWTGRYLQTDPIGLHGGLSRYSYVGGNPLGDIDPTGELNAGGVIVVVGASWGAWKLYGKYQSFEAGVRSCKAQCEAIQACGNPERQDILDANVPACRSSCGGLAVFTDWLGVGRGPTGPKSPSETPDYFKRLPPGSAQP